MDKQGSKKDEVDDMFDALLSKPEDKLKEYVCELEEIDPSQKGWEVVLHFEETDPKIPGTQAHEDLQTFTYFIKLWIANCEYKEDTNTAVFTHIDGCFEDQFADEHLKLMRRYTPKATATPEIRRIPKKEDAVPSTTNSLRDSASRILLEVTNDLTTRPPIIRDSSTPGAPVIRVPMAADPDQVPAAPQTQRSPEERRLEVPDDLLITLPLEGPDLEDMLEATSCTNLDEVLEKLRGIAEEEELLFEHGEADGIYIVNIYKDKKVKYLKPLDAKNMAFIFKLPHEKIGLTEPQS